MRNLILTTINAVSILGKLTCTLGVGLMIYACPWNAIGCNRMFDAIWDDGF